MLGDDDRQTLYLVTAPDSHAAKARATRNGAIEKVRTTRARRRASLRRSP